MSYEGVWVLNSQVGVMYQRFPCLIALQHLNAFPQPSSLIPLSPQCTQIGTLLLTSNQNLHRSSNCLIGPCFSPDAVTRNCFAFSTSGTPGTLTFVNLCAFGSPVWTKLAIAPA